MPTTSIGGNRGADSINGGAGNDTLSGGDGNDLFIFGLGGGDDTVDGGSGASWTDIVQLDGGADLGSLGTDWAVTVTDGTIASQDADSLVLSNDADGFITLQDGSELQFRDIEVIQW